MKPAPVDASALPRARAVAVALFVLTLLLFSRVLGDGYEFVNYDDPDYVTKNPRVQAGLSVDALRWALTSGEASNWHPLTWLSHALDWSWWGANPRGHHATSVFLHAINAVVAFAALRRLTGALWASAFCAAFFAWHPLRVESVAWVAERKDVLSGFFWFAVMWAYAVYAARRRAADARAGWYYGLALVAFALGLMAKPMLVTLPCVLLLLDIWPLRRVAWWADGGRETGGPAAPSPVPFARLVAEKVPFFVLAAASSFATFYVQQAGGSVTAALSLDARLANAVVAVVRYLGKFLWPFDLAVLYPHPGHWPAARVAAAVLILTAASGLAWWQARRRPWIAMGWLWFLGTLVPVIGLVQVGLQSMADRYTYLPILGVQLAVIWTVRDLVCSPAARRAWRLAGVALLAGWALRTWDQIGVWRNSDTLFSHAIAVTENNYVAFDNRGLHRFQAGRVDDALADYRRSLAINPGYMNANNNLGHALAGLGRPAEALPYYRAAHAVKPDNLEVRNNLANALSDLGQIDEAMAHYDFVLARRPDHANALNGSAVVLAMQGRPTEAKARLEHALRVAPDNAGAHNNLGNVCAMLGLRDEAIRHYRRATELNPREAHAFVLIGGLLNQQEKPAEAAESFRRAIAVDPRHAEAHAQLGLALARLGRRDDARRALQTALQLRPDYPEAKAWLQVVAEMR